MKTISGNPATSDALTSECFGSLRQFVTVFEDFKKACLRTWTAEVTSTRTCSVAVRCISKSTTQGRHKDLG